MTPYALVAEPVGDVYRRILQVSAQFVAFAGFVQLSDYGDDALIDLLIEAEPYLVSEADVTEYPGGVLLTRTAHRYLYRYEPGFRDLLAARADGLYSWAAPELPEDLHLLRQDGSTFLGSVSSEAHTYLMLTDSEAAAWLSSWPGSLVAHGADPGRHA